MRENDARESQAKRAHRARRGRQGLAGIGDDMVFCCILNPFLDIRWTETVPCNTMVDQFLRTQLNFTMHSLYDNGESRESKLSSIDDR